jgi:hypothetical protein
MAKVTQRPYEKGDPIFSQGPVSLVPVSRPAARKSTPTRLDGTTMHWEFKQEPGEKNRWRWRQVAAGTRETLKMSQLPFKTVEECVRDAEKHGYAVTEPPPMS